jgi:superfamily II DNA or RNA helicase
MKKLRPYQIASIDAINSALKRGVKSQLLVLPCGCHAKGTLILMFNGSVKKVEDIVIGDKLMGDDSTPRTVLGLARGNELMYKITPQKGDPFAVNGNHILALKRTGLPAHKEKYYAQNLEISVKDFLSLAKSRRYLYYLYRTSIKFNPKPKLYNPYLAGLWIGDGTWCSPTITKDEPEMDLYFENLAKEEQDSEYIIKKTFNKERCSSYKLTRVNHVQYSSPNKFMIFFNKFKLNNEKRICQEYLTGSREERLQLLAGIVDTDGYLGDDGCGYEITTKYIGLRDDLLFLARSLGLAAYTSNKIGEIKKLNFKGLYYRIRLSGDTDIIPCKIKRKQANPRRQIKNVLMTGIKIEALQKDDFYGFSLDSNHLYCMGDFTVTHNCGKTFTAVKSIKDKGRINFIVPSEELASQAGIALLAELELMPYHLLLEMIESAGGLINLIRNPKGYEIIANEIGMVKADIFVIDKPIVISSAQSLYKKLDKIPFNHFQVIVADEADCYMAKTFREPLSFFSYDLLLGLTATPERADGLPLDDIFSETVFEYSMRQAVLDGYLTKPIVVKLKTSANLDSVHTLAGEFNQKELTEIVNTPQRNYSICEAYLKHGQGRQFIVFAVDVQHAIDLCEAFNEKGVKCGYVVGDKELTPDRRGVLNDFHSGELTGLTNVMILSIGYDFCDIGVQIMARPTKSKRLFTQQIGRGMRLKSAKYLEKWEQNVIIIDVVDGSTKHKLINTDSIDAELELEDKIFISDANRDKLRDAKLKREALMQVQNREQDEIFELFPIPKIPRFQRSNEPATEMQLKSIERFGHDITNNTFTKAQVQDIFMSQMASKQDVDNLTGAGYNTSRGITMIESKLCYLDLIERDKKKSKQRIK